MPPKAKFTKEQIVDVAVQVTREKGIEAVTAREMGNALGVSTRPVFTWFPTIDALRQSVHARAKELFRGYIQRGMESDPLPFHGVGAQYIRFAREEPKLYALLFLSGDRYGAGGSAMETLRETQALTRPSIMQVYQLDAESADRYHRSMWLMSAGIATLIVTGGCHWSEEEISRILSHVSLSYRLACKELPGFPSDSFDSEAAFRSLLGMD